MVFAIRSEHIDALTMARMRDFVRRSLPHLRSSFPDQTAGLTDGELFDRGLAACSEAQRFGLAKESHLRRYLEADILLGAGFAFDHRRPAYGQVLSSPELNPDEKMRQVDDLIVFGD